MPSVLHKHPFFCSQTEPLIHPNEGSVHSKQTLRFPPTERLFHFVPNEPHPGTKKDFFSSVLPPSTPANRAEHGLLHTHENWHIFAENLKTLDL